MNKLTIAALFLGSGLSFSACADTFAGVYVGAQGWHTGVTGGYADSENTAAFNFDDKTNSSFYVAFEHFVPFVPNAKVSRTTMDSAGTTNLTTDFTFEGNTYTANTNVVTDSQMTSTDLILYYELFDNDLVSFDLGVNGKYIDGTFSVEDTQSATSGVKDFSGIVPTLYSRFGVGLPFTGLAAYAEGSYLSFDDHTLSDYQLAVTYSFIESLAVDMTVQLGYRNVSVDIEDLDGAYADLEYDGVFAGLELHF
ncbi:TIGR04219 family outer membrane beta-barrel protein [Alteromonas halophila]|uniref:Outer membrane protein n=1 Tax=Alteromonas halophila TaxID=516698 RepID=A0A918MZZ4_9ALTE|nr:TIGR04219 family outer membrane beta-barrel protein [Alteromonas halophila]GGW91743.1 outer membrane protein [Alteromonas halophila]